IVTFDVGSTANMGHHCCVEDCYYNNNNKFSANGNVTFHAFPVDPKERKQWILS
ncbi:hypothetical protein L9F63_004494, partial [Diploptera punctata]